MNLRTLKNFVAIADVGSFTGAAQVLFVAQPALTRQVRELELEFGVELLQRRPRGVVLTPAGGTFYEAARRILAEEAKLREKLARNQNAGTSTVILGAPPTLARVLLPGLLENCAHKLNSIKLGTREAFTPVLLEALERGTLDMAIVTNPESRQALSFQPILSEPFALISHGRMGIGPLVSIDQIADLPLLMTSLHRRIVERELLPLSKTLKVGWEINSVDAIREMVCNGHWATIMPVSVFKDGLNTEPLVMSQISGVQLNRHLSLATRIDPRPTPAAAFVQELIESEFERLSLAGRFNFAA